MELRLWVETAAGVDSPSLLVLTPVDEKGWQDWLKEIGPSFADAFPDLAIPARDEARFAAKVKMLAKQKWGFATLAPRRCWPDRVGCDRRQG